MVRETVWKSKKKREESPANLFCMTRNQVAQPSPYSILFPLFSSKRICFGKYSF